jgi:8-oxo-dGTP pyrophosphatase MutT (NUDIX family)
LSLPGGRVDPGEAVFAAAQRECEEEIGARFKDWYYVESVQPESKIDWYIHVFAAKNLLTSVPTHHDVGEKIEILDGTYEEFLAKSSAAIRIPTFQKHKTVDEVTNNATKLEGM